MYLKFVDRPGALERQTTPRQWLHGRVVELQVPYNQPPTPSPDHLRAPLPHLAELIRELLELEGSLL